MDYEKLYKESLERAKKLKETCDSAAVVGWCEYIFPELKENKEEKIRERILLSLEKDLIATKNSGCDTKYLEECISWLEKQDEVCHSIMWHSILEEPEEMQELLCEWESDDATWHEVVFYHSKSKTFWAGEIQVENVIKWIYLNELLEKQGEQKAINDTDEDIVEAVKDTSVLDLVEPKPAWSDEDEINLQGVLDEIEANKSQAPDYDLATYDRFLSWLKSLKERMRLQWKPSDEQMRALHDLNLTGKISYAGQGQELINLYNELKKLKA